LIAIWVWIAQQRSTPEVRFSWRKPRTDGSPQERWYPNDCVRLKPDQKYRIRINLTNIGTGPAAKTVINIIVPAWMDLEPDFGSADAAKTAHDPAVGNLPSNEMKYAVKISEEFFPGLPVVCDFSLSYRSLSSESDPSRCYFIAASVEAHELTASGRRFIPSWAQRIGGDDKDHWNQANWPGRRYRRSFRRVTADPRESVRCGPGRRVDRRPFVTS
jgi:hypothetical protein